MTIQELGEEMVAMRKELETLRAELKFKQEKCEEWSQEVVRLSKENQKMRAALEKIIAVMNERHMGRYPACDIAIKALKESR